MFLDILNNMIEDKEELDIDLIADFTEVMRKINVHLKKKRRNGN